MGHQKIHPNKSGKKKWQVSHFAICIHYWHGVSLKQAPYITCCLYTNFPSTLSVSHLAAFLFSASMICNGYLVLISLKEPVRVRSCALLLSSWSGIGLSWLSIEWRIALTAVNSNKTHHGSKHHQRYGCCDCPPGVTLPWMLSTATKHTMAVNIVRDMAVVTVHQVAHCLECCQQQQNTPRQ